MTRALTRTNFHSSRLIRVLADLAVVDAVEPGIAFAEKLGLWLNLHDAITLCAALNESTASQPTQFGVKSVTSVVIGNEFARIRASLVTSITKSVTPNLGKSRLELPMPKPGVPLEDATDYEPYRRYYAAHQRDMDSSVRPLRSNVRAVLAEASPALRQLAALDATLDAILCERESKLFSTVPLLLERRFEQLRQAHQQMLVDTQQADDPALWMKAGAWLARFCNELQTALLAELDLRLQPTVGLIEAINNEMTKHK
ncbi:MAG: DUF3348 domain-containing protein [Burkholderiaceae bacterium]|nr:DUF3348 domain-containing protein [Burkholderiaceae bacterium]